MDIKLLRISNHIVKRNISYFKLILRTVPTIPKIKEEEEMSIFENQEPTLNQPLSARNEQRRVYPRREQRPPQFW